MLFLASCGGGDPAPNELCDIPVTEHGSLYDGLCSNASNCRRDEACVDGMCTQTCTVADDCQRMLGCRADQTCGFCASPADCGAGKQCLSGYCMRTALHGWNLVMNPADWNALVADPYAQTEYPCSLSADSIDYPGCTVRARGQSSLDFPKLPLRIEFAENAAHPGYSRSINLRAEYNDRSFLRNVLSNELFARMTEIPTPRTSFVRLAVNGADQGVYVEYERISGKFLERHRRDRLSLTYESTASGELLQGAGGGLIVLPDPSQYALAYDQKTGEASTTALREYIEGALYLDWQDGGMCRTRMSTNLELYLDYLAMMAVLGGMDHPRKNFYFSLQYDAAGHQMWEFYPWDLDLTLGCQWTEQENVLCENQTYEQPTYYGTIPDGYEPIYPMEAVANTLIDIVAEHPDLLPELDKRVCEFLAHPAWTTEIYDLIDAYQAFLVADVRTDTADRNGGPGVDESGSETSFLADVDGVRGFFAARAAVLQGRLNCP